MQMMDTNTSKRLNKTFEVHSISIEDFKKNFPVNIEVSMPSIPEGHVAKLASIRIAK